MGVEDGKNKGAEDPTRLTSDGELAQSLDQVRRAIESGLSPNNAALALEYLGGELNSALAAKLKENPESK